MMSLLAALWIVNVMCSDCLDDWELLLMGFSLLRLQEWKAVWFHILCKAAS